MATNVTVNPTKLIDQKVKLNGVFDNSSVALPSTPVSNRYESIHPIFSSKGKGNKFEVYSDTGDLLSEMGDDLYNIKKYGQQGANALHSLQGGARVWIMRMVPEDVKCASAILSVSVKENDAIPQYQKDEDGYFLYDEDDKRIPIMEEVIGEDGLPTGEKKQQTLPGYTIKLVSSEGGTKNDSQIRNTADGWKTFPLFKFTSYKEGKCGNNLAFSIENDYSRDKQVSDGRRYYLNLFEANNTGTVDTTEGYIQFAFNPDALFSSSSSTFEGLNWVYDNRPAERGNHYRDMLIDYGTEYQNNYLELINLLSQRFDNESGNVFDIDFITCTDKLGQAYDTLEMAEGSINFASGGNRVFLMGGHEGSLEVGNVVKDAQGNDVTVTEEMVENTKLELLRKAFTFQLDKRLADCRKVSGGVVYDAAYDMKIKRVMGTTLINVRPDIMVMYDCGITSNMQEAIAVARDIRSVVNSSLQNHAIFPHCGKSKTLQLNKEVTQTFEIAYSIPKTYADKGSYYICSGYQGGFIRTIVPTWVIDGEDEEEMMKRYDLNYISDYGDLTGSADRLAAIQYYQFTERTLYNDELSVLKSLRNAMVVTTLIRIARRVLVKYTYYTEGMSQAQEAAKGQLDALAASSFPQNISISFSLYQTARDQILKNGSCDINVTFPDIAETFTISVYVNRTALNNAA